MANRVSFCIEVVEELRELFFVLENKKTGDLKLIFRRSLFHNPHNKNGLAGKFIDEQRYSIHTSPGSVHGINTIHHTYRLGEDIRHGYNFTKVVKARSGFALLFTRRCPDLAKPHYIPKETRRTNIKSLGAYDPRSFMFIYSVFVGPPGTPFSLYSSNAVCTVQQDFEKFSIVVIWNFLSLPSTEEGFKLHVENPHPEAIAANQWEDGRIDAPLQEKDCADMHMLNCNYLRHQALCRIEDQEMRNMSAIIGQFFQYGTRRSREFRAHVGRVNCSFLFPAMNYRCGEGSFSLEDGPLIVTQLSALL